MYLNLILICLNFLMFDKLTFFVINLLCGFKISLMRMPYKASQHSYGIVFVAMGFQMQAVRCSQDGACTWLLSLAHYPSGTKLPQIKLFCIQALWHCLSMPGKPRPLEALNSIVSAGPRDLRRNKSCTDGVWVHRTVTPGGCQVSQEVG